MEISVDPIKWLKKKTFSKNITVPLDFNFFKHPVFPYELKEDFIIRLELNFSEKVILRSGETAANASFYATTIGEHTKSTSIIEITKLTGRLTFKTCMFI